VMEKPIDCPVAPKVPFADHVYPTKSGRFEFITTLTHTHRRLPDFPLTLETNNSKTTIRIGTETAKEYGVKNRERIVIRSPVGHLAVEAIVDPKVGRGMVI